MTVSAQNSSPSSSGGSAAAVAGRGAMAIAAAKLWFMVGGWVLVFALPRLFRMTASTPEEGMVLYGLYGVAVTGISFLNNGIITGTLQAVSRFTARTPGGAATVRAVGMRYMAVAGGAVAVLYAVVSPLVARYWFGTSDPRLVRAMQVSAGIVAAYSLYAVFIGSLNGRHRFVAQAGFDIAYSTVKIAAILLAVYWGWGVVGALGGFWFAASAVTAAAWWATRNTRGDAPVDRRAMAGFAGTLITYTFALNVLLMIDLYVLGGYLARWVASQGGGNSQVVGMRLAQYKAVQQLAFIPYQAVIALVMVAFPMISKVTALGDPEATATYVRQALRATVVLLVGLAALFSAGAPEALRLVFPAGYHEAFGALRVLALGIVAFGVMVMANTALNAAGYTAAALSVVAAGAVAVMAAVWVSLAAYGRGDVGVTSAAAAGTAAGMAAAASAGVWLLRRKFGRAIPWGTMVRCGGAAAAVVACGLWWTAAGSAAILLKFAALGGVYVLVVALTGEFSRDDLRAVRAVVRRGS